MFLPLFSGRLASCVAAYTAAPDEMPTSKPSFLCKRSACSECVLVLDCDYFVINLGIKRFGNKACADTLYLMRSCNTPLKARASLRVQPQLPLHSGSCS